MYTCIKHPEGHPLKKEGKKLKFIGVFVNVSTSILLSMDIERDLLVL